MDTIGQTATPAVIIQVNNDTAKAVMVMNDGFPAGVGRVLLDHYDQDHLVWPLVDGGDIFELGITYDDTETIYDVIEGDDQPAQRKYKIKTEMVNSVLRAEMPFCRHKEPMIDHRSLLHIWADVARDHGMSTTNVPFVYVWMNDKWNGFDKYGRLKRFA